jgi:hypothetical protein
MNSSAPDKVSSLGDTLQSIDVEISHTGLQPLTALQKQMRYKHVRNRPIPWEMRSDSYKIHR